MLRKFSLFALCMSILIASGLFSQEPAPATATAQPPAGTWQLVPSPGGATLYALAALSARDVWAAGSGGRIQHWDGTGWTIVPSPVSGSIVALAPVAPDDIWGAVYDESTGGILHWDGTAWSAVLLPPGSPIADIAASAPDDVWAIGGPARSLLLHWDGTAWSRLAPPTTEALAQAAAVSRGDVWLVSTAPAGGAHFWHWDGRAWANVYTSRYTIHALSMQTANDGWAALGTCASDGQCAGELLHWNGTGWQAVLHDDRRTLQAVDGVRPAGAWATDGTDVLHWDGVNWTRSASPLLGVLAVDGLSPEEGWAVGYGTLRYTAAPTSVRLTQLQSRAPAGDLPLAHLLLAALTAGWVIGRIRRQV